MSEFYDYYRLLDLDPSASVETIKAARRRLIGVHFVDKHQGCEAALEITRRLNEVKEGPLGLEAPA